MPPAASRAPVLLSARVSLIRLWSSVSPPSFPRTCPCSGASFPPRGPSGWFPRFVGIVKHSDFLPPLPRRFVSFASRYRRASWASFPQLQDAATASLGLFTGIPITGFINGGDRTSQVPGEPTMNVPCSPTPARPLRSGRYRASMLPSAFSTASALARTVISGLNHTARPLAVYASQGGLPHHHARLASGWLASLSGRD